MTAGDLITELQKFPATAEVQVLAQDWNPKFGSPVTNIIDRNGNATPTSPLLLFYAGPSLFISYDQSGYGKIHNA